MLYFVKCEYSAIFTGFPYKSDTVKYAETAKVTEYVHLVCASDYSLLYFKP